MIPNPPLIYIARFIRDLLAIDEAVIKIGRDNIARDDTSSLQIAVDSISPAVPMSIAESFDSDGEKMQYVQQFSQECAVDFYGDSGYNTALDFVLFARSQTAYELQRDGGYRICNAAAVNDLRWLLGTQYSSRYQVAFTVIYSASRTETILRIDEPNNEIHS